MDVQLNVSIATFDLCVIVSVATCQKAEVVAATNVSRNRDVELHFLLNAATVEKPSLWQ